MSSSRGLWLALAISSGFWVAAVYVAVRLIESMR